MELEAAAGAPHALSAAGRALLQEGLGAAQRQDWPAAVAGLLGVTNQDSTRLDLLQQVASVLRDTPGLPASSLGCLMAVQRRGAGGQSLTAKGHTLPGMNVVDRFVSMHVCMHRRVCVCVCVCVCARVGACMRARVRGTKRQGG